MNINSKLQIENIIYVIEDRQNLPF